MGKFKSRLGLPPKQDNAAGAHAAKLTIRRNVLRAIGLDKAAVFDAFAGAGAMYDGVWKDAASYVGCDTRFLRDPRCCYVADNRRVMRAIGLEAFNVFDFDAYGSPWDQMLILASRRRRLAAGELLGVVMTEGTALKMKMGSASATMARLAGIRTTQPGLGTDDMQGQLINRALLRIAAMMGARIVKRWQATGKMGSRMLYIGLVLQGLPT
jgi:hypothetical protein